jgi:hypothetical protein
MNRVNPQTEKVDTMPMERAPQPGDRVRLVKTDQYGAGIFTRIESVIGFEAEKGWTVTVMSQPANLVLEPQPTMLIVVREPTGKDAAWVPYPHYTKI